MTLTQILEAGLAAAAAALALYCFVLARRLRRLNDLETGLGGAIAVMAAEVSRLEAALAGAQREATAATRQLSAEIEKARAERGRWQLQAAGIAAEAGAAPRARLRRRGGTREAADA